MIPAESVSERLGAQGIARLRMFALDLGWTYNESWSREELIAWTSARRERLRIIESLEDWQSEQGEHDDGGIARELGLVIKHVRGSEAWQALSSQRDGEHPGSNPGGSTK